MCLFMFKAVKSDDSVSKIEIQAMFNIIERFKFFDGMSRDAFSDLAKEWLANIDEINLDSLLEDMRKTLTEPQRHLCIIIAVMLIMSDSSIESGESEFLNLSRIKLDIGLDFLSHAGSVALALATSNDGSTKFD